MVVRHQKAEAVEHLALELRREKHALGVIVIADGNVFAVVPRIQQLARIALWTLEFLAGEYEF